MNSAIAFCFGSVAVYWSGIVIAAGALAGFLLAYSLYTAHSGRGSDMWILFAFSLILGVFFSRLVHVLSNPEQYGSLPRAFFDGSQGSFWLPGAVLALVPAAVLARRFGSGVSAGELLDAAAPGMALAAAFIRFSALFTNSCRSVFPISSPALQRYPFAAPAPYTDASGDVVYHFASFFIMALVMLLITVALVAFYIRFHGEKTKPPCSRSGNTARLFLAAYCAVEFVIDSTRSDASPVHFLLLRFLNRFTVSVRLTQLFAAVSLILLMVYYTRCSGKANGLQRLQKGLCVLFTLAMAGCIITEILLRRSDAWLLLYSAQTVSAVLAFACIFLQYRTCRDDTPEEIDDIL